MALDFPSPATDGQVWEGDNGVVYTFVSTGGGNGHWSGVQTNTGKLDDIYVQVAGDNMTGNLTLGPVNDNKITLNATAGSGTFAGNVKSLGFLTSSDTTNNERVQFGYMDTPTGHNLGHRIVGDGQNLYYFSRESGTTSHKFYVHNGGGSYNLMELNGAPSNEKVTIGGTLPSAPNITLKNNGEIITNADATINSLTVGRGAGNDLSNTTVGVSALRSTTTGGYNTAIGNAVLNRNTTGNNNTGLGYQAVQKNTEGSNNTGTGNKALNNNETGNNNTATGNNALTNNLAGSNNIATGSNALLYNTTGNSNIAIGSNTLVKNIAGVQNTAIGHQAGYYIEGSNNTILGGYQGNTADATLSDTIILAAGTTERLRIDSTGSLLFGGTLPSAPNITLKTDGEIITTADATINGVTVGAGPTDGTGSLGTNTVVGKGAFAANTTGTRNTVVGSGAMKSSTTAGNCVVIGERALENNITGGTNIGIGSQTLFTNVAGSQGIAIGYLAQGNANDTAASWSNHSIAIGTQALRGSGTPANNTGNRNIAMGYRTLYVNESGNDNVGIGYQSFQVNTTGSYNLALGSRTLTSNVTGSNNVAVGYDSMYLCESGDENTAVGYQSLRGNTEGDYNVALGSKALIGNKAGSNGTAIGCESQRYANDTLIPYNNTNVSIGYRSLLGSSSNALNTGLGNTAIGYETLNKNNAGSNNTAIGHQVLQNNTTGSGNIGIGFIDNAGTYAPVFNPITEDNRLVLGHTAITDAYVQVAWTVTSDARDKMNFAPVPYGLDFVNQLKPSAYQFKADRDTDTPSSDVRYGFKAQDILALEGDNPVIIDNEDPEHLKYRGESLVPVLVNAVQELTAMVEDLKAEVKALKDS